MERVRFEELAQGVEFVSTVMFAHDLPDPTQRPRAAVLQDLEFGAFAIEFEHVTALDLMCREDFVKRGAFDHFVKSLAAVAGHVAVERVKHAVPGLDEKRPLAR